MGKYIKVFDTHSEYNTYISGQDAILPNVSCCKNENEVHYNPWVETKLVCEYNISDISSATTLRTGYAQNMFKSMEIDGVVLDNLVTSYQFSTTGKHIVKYELYDETTVGNTPPSFSQISTLVKVSIPNSVTTIGDYAFTGCSGLTSITIPSSVTTIYVAFNGCSSLTSITIPNSVTSIGNEAFSNCSSLTNVTIQATTPPTLGVDVFSNNASGRKIYVPSASVNTYKAATNWSTYASDIEAIATT